MQYRQLGRSGLKISPICLGTMMFGGPTDEATSTRIVAKAREAGINFIDTADAYNGGNSEQVVGRAISNSRHNWVLATKLANPMGDDPNRAGLSRRWVLQAADESLKRLGTDYIDVYYLHKEDHSTPLDETVRAMGELVQKGRCAISASRIIGPGGSPKSATSAIAWASTARSSASPITMR
jgi:aryl-alcohol dehydrogenase (NADP+)